MDKNLLLPRKAKLGKIAQIEVEVQLVESYFAKPNPFEHVPHLFEADVLREFYESVKEILGWDSSEESTKNEG